MQVEATEPVGTTVGQYLIREIGSVDIENVKTVLVPIVKKDKLSKIHTASDLFEYFKCTGLNDLIILEALKHLLKSMNREDLAQYVGAYEFLLKTLVKFTGADNFYNVYKKIAGAVEVAIGQKDAVTLKKEYEDVIDSVRELHAIQTVSDLLSVLEDRDVLNNNDVEILENILEKFGEEGLKKLVFSYKILFISSPHCEICGCEAKINSKNNNTASPLDQLGYDDLEAAILYLCENLGPDWKKLARSLKLGEAKINSIHKDYILDTGEQIMQMLHFWRKTCDGASVASLTSALRSRICNFAYLANEIENKTYKKF